MRHVFLTAALSLSLIPAQALAQADDDVGSDDSSLPEGASTIAPERPNASKPTSTGRAAAPGTQHTVTRGDTLWDLSQKFLGSPWYWPKVWSYNPEIANPHWIYPGNEVRFYPGGEELPTQVEVGQQNDVDEGEYYDDGINVAGQIGFRPKNSQAVAAPGFVTSRELEESGRIVGSFSESLELTYPDHIYIEVTKKAPRLGESYLVYRKGVEVAHPVTDAKVGFLTEILAEVKVIRIDKTVSGANRATVQIVKQYDEVHRNDLLAPYTDPVIRFVAARPNERNVKDAIVVADVRRYPTMVAEHQLTIMDKGSDDGVKVGNVFTIYRSHDPFPSESLMQPQILEPEFPVEDIGQCVAFEVKAKASICLMSRSMREIVKGDHAEIRAAGSRRASR